MIDQQQSLLACARKRRHARLADAQHAAHKMQQKEPGKLVHTFYCALCGGYHIGTQPKERRA